MKRLFVPPGTYEPCGLFGVEHLILLLASAALITAALYFSRRMSFPQIRKTIWICTVILWIFEIIKIVFNLIVNGPDEPNHYIPLYFCSLTLYCGFMSAFGKGFVKRCGDTFLAVGSIIGGVMFLLCPNTSLPMYPFFHYITFQSFLYHSIMIYLGILVIMRGYVVLRAKDQIPYGTVVLIVGVVAYLVNSVLGTNLMFVSDNFPGTPLELVYRFTGCLFPLCMILIHIVPPFWVMYGISRLVEKRRRKAEKQQETPQGR